jgi:IclR family KDG regulon transcriptional repressor
MALELLEEQREGRFSDGLQAGLAILRCFSGEKGVWRIADLATETGMSRSTVHRYASTLVRLGWLEQDSSRRYFLAARAGDPGLAVLDSLEVRRRGLGVLRGLRDRTGYTASLGVLADGEVCVVGVMRGHREGQFKVDEGLGLGVRLPVHCTALGKALLAWLPEGELVELVEGMGRLSGGGPRAASSRQSLLDDVALTRAQGFAIDEQESRAGVRGVACVVSDGDGPVAAIQIMGSTQTAQMAGGPGGKRAVREVRIAAGRLSSYLGEGETP